MTGLYKNSGLAIYEKVHYSHGEHINEVERILTWYGSLDKRILDIGCSGGLHALEFARKGYFITGLDIEPSAIELAKKRNASSGQKADFMIFDIEKNEIPDIGKFNFIYAIGNVISHVRKTNLFKVLSNIRRLINDDGIFLFDVLINGKPFQEEIIPGKNGIQIIWKRKIDEKTGKISMQGIFLEFCFKQHFDVWGYTIEEITELLRMAGFCGIEFCEKLDFNEKNNTKNPISLYFRAKGELNEIV
jgi:2-polyprenyl-3-methyl-5-hydroxy-6-metoxy-1,4-benzoquinol methylase